MSRIAIVSGIRTPFAKAWTDFWDMPAQELGRLAVRELLERTAIEPNLIDEVIFGTVANPPEAANMARVISGDKGSALVPTKSRDPDLVGKM